MESITRYEDANGVITLQMIRRVDGREYRSGFFRVSSDNNVQPSEALSHPYAWDHVVKRMQKEIDYAIAAKDKHSNYRVVRYEAANSVIGLQMVTRINGRESRINGREYRTGIYHLSMPDLKAPEVWGRIVDQMQKEIADELCGEAADGVTELEVVLHDDGYDTRYGSLSLSNDDLKVPYAWSLYDRVVAHMRSKIAADRANTI